MSPPVGKDNPISDSEEIKTKLKTKFLLYSLIMQAHKH